MISKSLRVIKKELLEWGLSSVYFALWFCALTFYNQEVAHISEKGFLSYGFSILKAVVLTRLLIFAQLLQSFSAFDKSEGAIAWFVVRRTTITTIFVLLMRCAETGIEGFFGGHGFIDSMLGFFQGESLKLLALTFLYWLIVMPYVAYSVLQHLAGATDVRTFLRSQTNHLK